MAVPSACLTFLPQLSGFIDGELPPAAREQVERHLAACADCTGRVADLRAESGLIRVGMELAADEVDFSQFSAQVMAKLTPYKPPLLERLRVAVIERFTYQRGLFLGGLGVAAAALVAVVAVPLLMDSPPVGYASRHLEVESVSTDADAHVSPMLINTESGDAIIWLVDHGHHDAPPADGAGAVKGPAGGKESSASDEDDEEEAAPARTPSQGKQEQAPPDTRNGGEL